MTELMSTISVFDSQTYEMSLSIVNNKPAPMQLTSGVPTNKYQYLPVVIVTTELAKVPKTMDSMNGRMSMPDLVAECPLA